MVGACSGACLGGNLTIVGASANVVVANMASREGHPIRFLEFLRYGLVVTVVSLLIATAYVWLRYLDLRLEERLSARAASRSALAAGAPLGFAKAGQGVGRLEALESASEPRA